ncbi:MAG: nicotinate phosphoribosyltransferase [Frankiales bacterium]|nr:nicotinate phosphoribosyltransferase [Frankiales bacterium]
MSDGGTGSVALLTDRYELTMLDALLHDQPDGPPLAERRAVFEVFTRRLPPGRRFGIVAGQGRLATALPALRFGDDDLTALDGVVSARALSWLAGRSLSLEISAYAEGEVFVAGSPVLTVQGRLGEGLLLETLALSVLNADSAIASAAARMVLAAQGRPLLEMGGRRTHEQAAVSAARAAYVAGFAATSNLEAGRRHGVPTVGTSAHAFTLAHGDEPAAFRAQVAALGQGTTLLVDTYDTEQGIRHAVEAAGTGLGAVRLDSGDPAEEARRARALLDGLGATRTRIVTTGDLDEHRIAELSAAPVDVYGVGTSLVTGSGAPTCGFVYKLVAVEDPDGRLRPVAKRSAGKATVGGRKWAYRTRDGRELLLRSADAAAPEGARPLQQPLPDGDAVEQARAHCASVLAALPEQARRLDAGPAAYALEFAPDPALETA